MTRVPVLHWFPALLLALALTSCDGKDEVSTPPPGPQNGAVQPPPTKSPTGTRPSRSELPKAAPLTRDVAQSALYEFLGELDEDEVSRAVVLYLADIGDRKAVNFVHEHLLARDGGEYDSTESAAIGYEALIRYGEVGAAEKLLEVARTAIDEGEWATYLAHALGAVEGPLAADADKILLQLTDYEDDEDVGLIAVSHLARRRVTAAADRFAAVAGDADLEDMFRGAALAGLAAVGDSRTAQVASALVKESLADLEPDDVILGLGIEGVTEALPLIRQFMDAVVEADELGFEGASACFAVGEIYQHAPDGFEEAMEYLEVLRGGEDFDCEDEAAAAMFRIRAGAYTDAVAAQLKAAVIGAKNFDSEEAVILLGVIGRRGLAKDPAFAPLVDAAAQLVVDNTTPPRNRDHGRLLRAAAAYAFLKSSDN